MSIVALVLAALVGCGGEAADQGAAAAGAVTEAAPAEGTAAATEAAPVAGEAAPAAAAAGALTKAQLDEAATLVFPMQPWTEAEAALKAKIGDVQKSEGDNAMWFAKDGAACMALTVQKMGDSVGSAAVAASTACP